MTQDIPGNIEYLTLSHCWGENLLQAKEHKATTAIEQAESALAESVADLYKYICVGELKLKEVCCSCRRYRDCRGG